MKLRDYNSSRYAIMTVDESRESFQPRVEAFENLMTERKHKKQLRNCVKTTYNNLEVKKFVNVEKRKQANKNTFARMKTALRKLLS